MRKLTSRFNVSCGLATFGSGCTVVKKWEWAIEPCGFLSGLSSYRYWAELCLCYPGLWSYVLLQFLFLCFIVENCTGMAFFIMGKGKACVWADNKVYFFLLGMYKRVLLLLINYYFYLCSFVQCLGASLLSLGAKQGALCKQQKASCFFREPNSILQCKAVQKYLA